MQKISQTSFQFFSADFRLCSAKRVSFDDHNAQKSFKFLIYSIESESFFFEGFSVPKVYQFLRAKKARSAGESINDRRTVSGLSNE